VARFVTELLLRLTDAVSAPARQAAQSIKGITRAIKDQNVAVLTGTSKALGREIRGLTGDLVGAGGALAAFTLAVRAPVRGANEFESKLTTIGQKAGLSRIEMRRFGDELVRTSRVTNQSVKELTEGVDVLTGKGLDPRLALQMIATIGRSATAYEASVKDLAGATFAVVNNLKVPISDVSAALDAMAAAGNAGSFEIKDMAQYLPELAAAAGAIGQKGVPAVTDLAAALQVVANGTGSASTAATNLANLLQKRTAQQTVKAFD
jgi:TP901 family phage tail tape measure protein